MEQDTLTLATSLLARLTDKPHLIPLAARIVRELRPIRHGPDFASLFVSGKTYSFTPGQAAAVRVLWKAWRNNTPDVRQETILCAIGSDAGRLQDLFRDHPAWGEVIVPGQAKGSFRLSAGAKSGGK